MFSFKFGGGDTVLFGVLGGAVVVVGFITFEGDALSVGIESISIVHLFFISAISFWIFVTVSSNSSYLFEGDEGGLKVVVVFKRSLTQGLLSASVVS